MTVQFAINGAPLKAPGRKYKGLWPAPVYVAKFADGSTGRASFYSDATKPLDYERGRVCSCYLWREGFPDINAPARKDIIGGHVEHEGVSYPDPHFSGEAKKASSAKRDPIATVVRLLPTLSWEQLEVLQAAIDERLAA